jgi:hypothetical protein
MLFNRRNVCLSHISGDCFNRLFTTLLSLPEPIKALTLKKIEQTMSEIAQSLRVTQTIPQDLAAVFWKILITFHALFSMITTITSRQTHKRVPFSLR